MADLATTTDANGRLATAAVAGGGGGGVTFPLTPESAAAGDDILTSDVTGDANPRFSIDADGNLQWGSGAAALDVAMHRTVGYNDRLELLDELWVRPGGAGTHGLVFKGGNTIASEVNVDLPINLALPVVATREFYIGGLLSLPSGESFIERADPAAPPANQGHLYVRDNGAGKSQLCIRFNTGAIQVLATEP